MSVSNLALAHQAHRNREGKGDVEKNVLVALVLNREALISRLWGAQDPTGEQLLGFLSSLRLSLFPGLEYLLQVPPAWPQRPREGETRVTAAGLWAGGRQCGGGSGGSGSEKASG